MPELLIHHGHKCVYFEDRQLYFAPLEYEALLCLAQKRGNVVDTKTLSKQVYRSQWDFVIPEVQQTIYRLRKRLRVQGIEPGSYLVTVPYFGYRLLHARVIYSDELTVDVSPISSTREIEHQSETTVIPRQASIANKPWDTLTLREWEIFISLADDQKARLTNRELAEALCISQNTLKKHLQRIYRKLGVNRRYAAMQLAMQAKAERRSSYE